MKFSCISIITIAVSTVTGAYIDNTPADKTVDSKLFNGTTYGHQNSIATRNDTTSTNITTLGSSSNDEDAATDSIEAEKEYEEEAAEVAEYIALDIQNDLEDNNTLPPGKLCATRRKPRCCEVGGRVYKDGCERLSMPLPANRNEFRSTCEEANKVAYCCRNSVDMESCVAKQESEWILSEVRTEHGYRKGVQHERCLL
ncbi:uncharacterized protein Bfra_010191 [Botrytis fragariae]|uniref:Uncharacterized protein n=1 Tax=Botrytis fragariae TaxID=1964551 RepID=A0A8H6EFJ2_9HELO|nr:uncharacterized protein Bfra_010191 [Botrytis fragariae]KAF5870045.1 hypothetical protein Bfra_010191 [Botrytis fragariae]